MSNTTALYWLTRLDSFNSILILVFIFSAVYVVATLVGCMMHASFDEFERSETKLTDRKNSRQSFKKKIKPISIIGIICILIVTFLPTRDEMVFIVAGGKTLDFVQSDTSISKIPSQTTEIISKFLDKEIKELEGDTVK